MFLRISVLRTCGFVVQANAVVTRADGGVGGD